MKKQTLMIVIWIITMMGIKPIYSQTFLGELCSIYGFSKGYAITAEHLGLESAYKNPAGITHIRALTIGTGYSTFFDNGYYAASLGIGLPVGSDFVLSLNVPIRVVDGIPETVEVSGLGEKIGTFSDTNGAIILSLGSRHLAPVYLGVSLKGIFHTIMDTSATGIAFDAGVLAELGIFKLGASVQNAGSTPLEWDTGNTDEMTQQINLGISAAVIPDLTLLADTTIESNQSLINFGAEFNVSPMLSVQGGLKDISGDCFLTFGTRIAMDNIQMFYAYAQHEALGGTHKFGFTSEF
ncbi:hypothetical protein ACFL96_01440 [Thermoproteota archaeon]